MILEIIAWLCAALSLVGAALNARMSVWSYYLWIPANVLWVVYFVSHRQWASAFLFLAYEVLAVYGAVHWNKKRATS